VQSESSTSAQSHASQYVWELYGSNATNQLPIPHASYGYSSYYSAVPPPPLPSVPGSLLTNHRAWEMCLGHKSSSAPPVSSAEKTTYGADAEYEKFMSEMK
jgi:splicing factor 1